MQSQFTPLSLDHSTVAAFLAVASSRRLAPRAGGSPAETCCTPDQAREWVELVSDDPALHAAALRHLAEVEDAWLK